MVKVKYVYLKSNASLIKYINDIDIFDLLRVLEPIFLNIISISLKMPSLLIAHFCKFSVLKAPLKKKFIFTKKYS